MTNCTETEVLADCPIPVVWLTASLLDLKKNALIESDNDNDGFMAAEHLAKCGQQEYCLYERADRLFPAGADDTKVIWMCVKIQSQRAECGLLL